MSTVYDRRIRRSENVSEALFHQLEACCEDASLTGMILSDESGTCMAAAGPPTACEEIAATLPILGRKAGDFHGVLLSADGGLDAMMQRFIVDDMPLFLCALGGDELLRARQIARSMSGVARILATV